MSEHRNLRNLRASRASSRELSAATARVSQASTGSDVQSTAAYRKSSSEKFGANEGRKVGM